MRNPWWEGIISHLRQVISPVTLGAAAMTAVVVLAYLPVLQADAAEVRGAIVKPDTEANPGLHALAALAHQLFFVEAVFICEILLIGTIFILVIKFGFYIVRLVIHEYRRTRRELRGPKLPRPRVTESRPKAVPQADELAKTQGQQRRLDAPQKQVYLIEGPSKVQDARKPAEVKDVKAK